MENKKLIEIENLKVHFNLNEGILEAVNDVTLSINEKETLGIIGESGCGKSVTAQSILRIIPKPGEIKSGKIKISLNDKVVDLIQLDAKSKLMRSIRGRHVSMIFQEPMTSLSPVHTIGNQLEETILLHTKLTKKEAREFGINVLQKVGISNSKERIHNYPHELSGGLRQRVMIGMALSCNPKLLIADEPTTALDVTVQAQILDLLSDLKKSNNMSMLYISHDLGVISEISDKIAVMYLGRVVEITTTDELFTNPLHPYTQLLIKSIPTLGKSKKIKLSTIEGNVPIPLNLKKECGFYSRCPQRIDGLCNNDIPVLSEKNKSHQVRCFLYN